MKKFKFIDFILEVLYLLFFIVVCYKLGEQFNCPIILGIIGFIYFYYDQYINHDNILYNYLKKSFR